MNGRTSRLAPGALAALCLAVLGTMFAAAPAAATTTTLDLSVYNPTFSPNGDDNDDEAEFEACISPFGAVTTEILDASQTVIATVEPGYEPDPEDEPSCWYLSWDGRNTAGVTVPDGTYTLRVRAVADPSAEATEALYVDKRIPGTLTKPVDGQNANGPITFEFTPTAGFDINTVRFDVGPQDYGSVCDAEASLASGVWRATIDVTACGMGTLAVGLGVGWTDAHGEGHWYSLSDQTVINTPSVPLAAHFTTPAQSFSPNGDEIEDQIWIGYCVLAQDEGTAHATARIVDSAGATVRTFDPVDLDLMQFCQSWYDDGSGVSWNGTDDAGELLPEGNYEVILQADDDTHPVVEARLDVAIDNRPPGAITSPADGAHLVNGSAIVVTPTAGVEITDVTYRVLANAYDACDLTATKKPNGTWAGTPTADNCPVDNNSFVLADVSWKDAYGHEHEPRRLGPAGVAAGLTLAGDRVFSPDGDGNDDYLTVRWCLLDPSVSSFSVHGRILDAEGSVVRELYDLEQEPDNPDDLLQDTCQGGMYWDGTDAGGASLPNGEYTAEVDAVAEGRSYSERQTVVIDRRVVGRIVSPANGGLLSGGEPVVYRLNSGFIADSVTFSFETWSGVEMCSQAGEQATDGSWTTTPTGEECSVDDETAVRAYAHWTDQFGLHHTAISRRAGVAAHVAINGSRQFSPNNDQYEDTLSPSWCVLTPGNDDPIHVTARILDSTGTPIKVLEDADRVPDLADRDWYDGCVGAEWNGTNSAGSSVNDGEYTLEVVAQRPAGAALLRSEKIVVERDRPAYLDYNVSATPDNLRAFVVPSDRVNLNDVAFSVHPASYFGCFVGQEGSIGYDGTAEAILDVSSCQGAVDLDAAVYWTDRFGLGHEPYMLKASNILAGRPTVSLSMNSNTLTPDGDGDHDVLTVSACVTDPAQVPDQRFVRVGITTPDGAPVRELVAGKLDASSAYQPWYGCGAEVTWDGTDSEGILQEFGQYLITASIEEDGEVVSSSATYVELKDATVVSPAPGEFLSPVDGSVGGETIAVDFAPDGTHDFTVYASGFCYYGYTTTADADGHYRFDAAHTTSSCGSENAVVYLNAYWINDEGFYENYTEQRIVRVPQAPVANPPQLSSALVQPTSGYAPTAATTIWPCASDSADGGPLTGTLRVLNEAGNLVRGFDPLTLSPHSQYSTYCGSGSTEPQVVWDGRDDDGDLVSDGTYTIEFVVTDHDDLSDTTTATVEVASDVPGSVVEPIEGSTVVNGAQFGFKPTAGVTINGVTFGLRTLTDTNQIPNCRTSTVVSADLDGVYRASLDTIAFQCGNGPRLAQAYVTWIDGSGRHRSTYTKGLPVTLGNATVAPTVSVSPNARTFSPNGDDNDDVLYANFVAYDSQYGDPLHVRLEVLDASGATVRTILDGDRAPSPYTSGATWDGLDEDGEAAPEGQYRFKVTATDSDGLSATQTSIVVVIDNRVPVTLSPTYSGDRVSGTIDLTVIPTEAFDVRSATAYLQAVQGEYTTYTCYKNLAADQAGGNLGGTLDLSECGVGSRDIRVSVSWYDSFSRPHSYNAVLGSVVIDPTGPQVQFPSYVPHAFSPDQDGWEDTYALNPCVLGGGEQATVTHRIVDADGNTIRTFRSSSVQTAPVCPSYWYGGGMVYANWDGRADSGAVAPDGPYRYEVTATTDAEGSDTQSVELAIDTRPPGTPVSPERNSTLYGDAEFVYQPSEGVDITEVGATVSGANISGTVQIDSPDDDGSWRGTIPVTNITSGPATVWWHVTWDDQFGSSHYRSTRAINVNIDSENPPLALTGTALYGSAPFTAKITAQTEDARDRDVTLKVNWQDGSPVETLTVSKPYLAVPLSHVYDYAGSYGYNYYRRYYPTVVATTPGGGLTTRQVAVTVYPRPVTPPPTNHPPTVQVTTDPTSGTAPLDVTTTLAATDSDGDTLQYVVNFGDGTAATSGTLPAEPIGHRYTAGGTYIVKTTISDGKTQVVRYSTITVALDEPLAARAGDDLVVQKGESLALDGTASRPQAGISRYNWDFGDGTAKLDGATVNHTYATAGTYHARLTVYAGDASEFDEITVVVTDPQPIDGGLAVRVQNTSGALIVGADLLVQLPDGQRISAVTSSNGVGRLFGLPDGFQTLYVAKPGYLPKKVSANVSGGRGEAVVTLESGNVATAVLTAERMTPAQVEAAGIDSSDPANQQVVTFTVQLTFQGFTQSFSGYHSISNTGAPSFPQNVPCVNLPDDYRACPQAIAPDGKPGIAWIVAPGKAKWLKEFFQVTLQVTNLATDAAFKLDHGSATLNVPDGMSLAQTTSGQSATMAFPDVPAGGTQSLSWIVRGDTAGSYNLNASYAGTMQPTGTPVSVQASLDAPLKVWGASALRMTVDVDDSAYGDWDPRANPFEDWVGAYPYHATMTLKNVADVPVYNLDFGLTEYGRENFVLQPLSPESLSSAQLNPGQSISREFILIPAVSGELDPAQSFVSRSAGVDTIDTTVTDHPRAVPTQDVPKFDVFQGENGKAMLTFEAVPGATSYRVFTRSGLDGGYHALPTDDPHMYYVAGTGPTTDGVKKVVLTGLDPDVDRYFVISSMIDGVPTMVHRLAPLPGVVNKPVSSLDFDTANGGGHTCGKNELEVTFHFADSFGLQSWTIDPQGSGQVGYLEGDTLTWVPELTSSIEDGRTILPITVKIRIPHNSGDAIDRLTVKYWAYNIAGDGNEDEPFEVVLDTACPRRDMTVVAMGLFSSIDDSGVLSTSSAPSSCPTSADNYTNQAATNACTGAPGYGDPRVTAGNLVAYLNTLGYYQGDSRDAGDKDLIDFSYNGADVSCYGPGGPEITPHPYPVLRTWQEIGQHVSVKSTDTAEHFLDHLEDYAECWKDVHGETLHFNLIGHSLGGYEVLAMANAAHNRRAEGKTSVDIASVTTIDGAIHPSVIYAELLAGECFTDSEEHPIVGSVLDVGTEKLKLWLTGTVLGPLNVALHADAILGEQNRVGAQIDKLKADGTRIATVTNVADGCLFEDGTVNSHAQSHKAYDVNAPGWVGTDGHSALLKNHVSPVDETGYPVTGTINWALNGHRGHSFGAGRGGLRSAFAQVESLLETPVEFSIAGRAVDPTSGEPLEGAHLVLVGEVERFTNSAADGTFQFNAVPAGTYKVSINPRESGLQAGWVGGVDESSAEEIALDADHDLGDIAPALRLATTVTVLDENGEPAPDAGVVVSNAAGHQVVVGKTDSEGHLDVVTARGSFEALAASPAAASPSVTFEAGHDTTLRLIPIATVSAALTDDGGDPVPSAVAGLYDAITGEYVGSTVTDDEGNAVFPVPPGGSYVVQFADTGGRFTGVPETTPVTPELGDPSSGQTTLELGVAPTLDSNSPPATVDVGVPVDFAFQATVTGTPVWNVVGGALPTGLSLGADGHLTGAATETGAFVYRVKVTDQNGSATSGEFNMVVRAKPTTPTGSPPTTGKVGTALAATTFSSTGSPAPSFSLTGALPAGLDLSGGGTLSGTPTESGSFSYYVVATNAAGSATAGPFILTIAPPDVDPCTPGDPCDPCHLTDTCNPCPAGDPCDPDPPVITAPGVPTAVTATPVNGGASVTWAPPVSDGGEPVLGYVVVPILDGVKLAPVERGATARGRQFHGLVPGSTYTFEISARNAHGIGSIATTGPVLVTVRTAIAITSAPRVAVYRAPITVSGTVTRTDTGAAVEGAGVALQYRRAGTTGPFTSYPNTRRTALDGAVSFTGFRPRYAVDVRLVVLADSGLLVSRSSIATVACRRLLTVAPSAAVVDVGQTIQVRGTATPLARGRIARLQVWDGFSWQLVGRRVIGRLGRFSIPMQGAAAGRIMFRVVVPASAGYARTVSSVKTVTVGG